MHTRITSAEPLWVKVASAIFFLVFVMAMTLCLLWN